MLARRTGDQFPSGDGAGQSCLKSVWGSPHPQSSRVFVALIATAKITSVNEENVRANTGRRTFHVGSWSRIIGLSEANGVFAAFGTRSRTYGQLIGILGSRDGMS